jgi:hypothetical protein
MLINDLLNAMETFQSSSYWTDVIEVFENVGLFLLLDTFLFFIYLPIFFPCFLLSFLGILICFEQATKHWSFSIFWNLPLFSLILHPLLR